MPRIHNNEPDHKFVFEIRLGWLQKFWQSVYKVKRTEKTTYNYCQGIKMLSENSTSHLYSYNVEGCNRWTETFRRTPSNLSIAQLRWLTYELYFSNIQNREERYYTVLSWFTFHSEKRKIWNTTFTECVIISSQY